MPVTDDQARALAYLAKAIRPHHARQWDEAGIVAAIRKVRDRSLASVAIAVVQAAEDRGAHTPGVIPKAGPHWRAPETAPIPDRVGFDAANTCDTCGLTRDGCLVRWGGNTPDGHTFESVAARRARTVGTGADHVREQLQQASEDWCPRHRVRRDTCPCGPIATTPDLTAEAVEETP